MRLDVSRTLLAQYRIKKESGEIWVARTQAVERGDRMKKTEAHVQIGREMACGVCQCLCRPAMIVDTSCGSLLCWDNIYPRVLILLALQL